MKKVILAFSGGLDTSFCVPFLKEKGYQVVALTVDTGGFTKADLDAIARKAGILGVSKHVVVDAKDALYSDIATYVIKANILRGGVYPVCVSAERVVQAQEVVALARKEKANTIAHGSTGAGNDQVRFDVYVKTLYPELTIITPIRELGISRKEEVLYLRKKGISIAYKHQLYSINRGFLGTTIGGGQTHDSQNIVPDSMYPSVVPITQAPDEGVKLSISFEKGLPVGVNDKTISGVALIGYLHKLGAKHGVGKGAHLGDTILGIKGRIAFEAPAPLILIKAHKELEKLVLTKAQLFWKDLLSQTYGNYLHEGLYFDPVMRDIEKFIDSSQKIVTGKVGIKLHKGHILVQGITSPFSLMDTLVYTYGEESSFWSGQDAAGFSAIHGLQGILAHMARLRGESYGKNKD